VRNLQLMKKRPSISEAELQQHMDFNQVLAGYQQHQIAAARWWQWVVGGGLLAVGAFVAYVYLQSPPQPVPANSESTSTPQPAASTMVSDSIASATEPGNREPKPELVVQEKTRQLPPQVVETPPVTFTPASPLNGYEDLYAYFHRELRYPEAALADSVEGVVTVSFIINKQGQLEQFKIEQSLGSLFDEEALRLARAMPPWIPARLGNEPTRSKLTLPITFRIEK
jgi:TonB family protein